MSKRRYSQGVLFVLPVITVMIVIIAFPLLYNIYLSFHQSSIYTAVLKYVGMKNFVSLISDDLFIGALKNTIIWAFGSVFFQVTLGFAAALVVQNIYAGKRIFQALILIPWIMPGIAAAAIWKWMYHPDFGALTYLVAMIGFTDRLWLGDPQLALYSVMVVNIWKMYPFAMLMLFAGLRAIPKSLYEAAVIDGANSYHTFMNITLPMMRNVLAILTLLLIIWAFNSFTFIFAMTHGGPGSSSEILGLRIYKDALKNMMFGKAAAEALILFVMMLVFSVVYLPLIYRQEK